jgi:nitrogen-specific signal transduction histidine kinase
LLTLWSIDPVNRDMILLNSVGASAYELGRRVYHYPDTLSGNAISAREPLKFSNICELDREHRSFYDDSVIGKLDLNYMVAVPILNTFNINQVLLLLNVYPASEPDIEDVINFRQFGESLAGHFESLLRDKCIRFANRLDVEMGKIVVRAPVNTYKTLVKLLQRAASADLVQLFLEKSGGGYLKREYSTGKVPDEDAARIEELAIACWQENREKMQFRSGDQTIHYRELLPHATVSDMRSWVFVPLRDLAGRAKGSIFASRRCVTPAGQILPPFTYEDICLVEAICRSFSAQLEILMADFARISSLDKLGHELRLPLSAFRAAVEKIQSETEDQGISLAHDYFFNVRFYCDTMKRLLFELDAVRKGPRALVLQTSSVRFHADIIAPAVRFLKLVMLKERLKPKQVKYGKIISNIPELFLDQWLMTQVVFNLLENSIKYSRQRKADVEIEIEGVKHDDNFEIVFRDNGIGITPGYEDKIFLQGIRAPEACLYHVLGEGFGLWFSREIVSLHGGRLELRSSQDPTEFAIVLPASLEYTSPSTSTLFGARE